MTRSIAKSKQRRYDEGKRNGDQNSGAQPKARHYGGVGADHHQLAVGHVDHAHDAVGDGEAQRHKQQNRPDAQADEQRIDHGFTNAAAGSPGGRLFGSDQVFLSLEVSRPFDVQNRLSSVSP